MDAIPVLHKHFRTSRWLLVIATVSIVACCVWTLWQWTCRPQAALSVECKNRLRTVYMAWLQHQESRATNGVAQGGQPAKQEAVPKPFHMSELGIGDTFCPIVFGLTEGKVKSPFLLTYGFRKRGADRWESVVLGKGEVPIIRWRVPLVFVGDSLSSDDGRYGRGWICYADGSVGMGFLPTSSWPISYGKDNTIEIHFHEDDPRFPWANRIEAILVQLLDTGEQRDVVRRFRE